MVIEQYSIAATPKYNFPHPTMDTILPQRFIELSLTSLKNAGKHAFQLNQQNLQQPYNIDGFHQTVQLGRPILLKQNHQETTIAAVDTSTTKVGETAAGLLIAVRGANVWRQHRAYRYARFGPFIFHITEENKTDVYSTLQRTHTSQMQRVNHHVLPNLLQMPMRIASLLERWLQTALVKTISHGLILFDGSLTAGTPDTPTWLLKELLDAARNRHNVVLALSKATTLRTNGHLITDTPQQHRAAYITEVAGLRPKPPTVLLGDVYVARLTKANVAFRLDIDRQIPVRERVPAMERLLGNDVVSDGYPETLRLAHILCTFTANEIIAMQHFATQKCGLEIVNRPDMHRLLFGLYGKGESYQ